MMHKLADKILHPHRKEEVTDKPAVVVEHTEKGHHHGQVVNEGVTKHETIVKPAIVDETVRTDKVIEVQPVIHKEVVQPVVHHVEEHVIEPAAPNVGGTFTNVPIVDEHVKTRVIEEVQPIIHREVAVPRVEKVEEHITERVVAPTIHTHEVKETIVQPTTVTQHVAAGGHPAHVINH